MAYKILCYNVCYKGKHIGIRETNYPWANRYWSNRGPDYKLVPVYY